MKWQSQVINDERVVDMDWMMVASMLRQFVIISMGVLNLTTVMMFADNFVGIICMAGCVHRYLACLALSYCSLPHFL